MWLATHCNHIILNCAYRIGKFSKMPCVQIPEVVSYILPVLYRKVGYKWAMFCNLFLVTQEFPKCKLPLILS